MLPRSVQALDGRPAGQELEDAVLELSVADIEGLSITDISALDSNVLKDLLNDAIRTRLESHKGGTYTSAPKLTLAQVEAVGA